MSGQSKLQSQQQQQQNHPPPELTNICLLAIFSQMDVDDRISAQTVCPRWYHRVRETYSKTVRSLTIALGNKYLNRLANLEGVLNWYSVASDSNCWPKWPTAWPEKRSQSFLYIASPNGTASTLMIRAIWRASRNASNRLSPLTDQSLSWHSI